jgi:hypothetical protein
VAPIYENWTPQFDIVSSSGAVVQTLTGSVDLHGLVADQRLGKPTALPTSKSTDDALVVETLPRGSYSVRVRVVWREHKVHATHTVEYPPMELAQPGRDSEGGYPVTAFTTQ